MNLQDIDNKINYEAFYMKYVQRSKSVGTNELLANCPFHNDKHASLSINTKTGLWKCHACNESGNAQLFLQKLKNISPAEAITELKNDAGIVDEPTKKRTTKAYRIGDYSEKKMLPVEFLTKLGIRDYMRTGIAIPYTDFEGSVVATRKRLADQGKSKFAWIKGSKLIPYGLWKMDEVKKTGKVILVEGESDAHTLWYHSYPTIGIPGASTFNNSWVKYFDGLEIYIFKEPDIGGQTFVQSVCESLAEQKYAFKVFEIRTESCKDPSELYEQDPKKFKENWEAVMQSATEISIFEHALGKKNLIPNIPFNIRQVPGWMIDADSGIRFIDGKGQVVSVCPVPVILTKRLKSLDTGDEKIELAFKRDGKWHTTIANRSMVFQTRTVTGLSDKGLPLTSETAKPFVKFLGDMEAANLDILPLSRSTDHLGWIDSKRFIPGLAGEVTLDIDPQMSTLANAYSCTGKEKDWENMIDKIRENQIARFIIATSFAAPLIRPLKHRIFIVHNWGDSRIGKTAALKAALSVWGDPEMLMANFNATRVGLERLAGFYNDLPLGIDERQVAGNRQEFIDGLIYLLGMGKGKTRGAKNGGLQSTSFWRCAILTTGEDPLTSDSSQGGIHTRVLEVYGRPFDKEEQAKEVHQVIGNTYGHAGIKFVKRWIAEKAKNPKDLSDAHKSLLDTFAKAFPHNLGSHLSAVALVSFADFLVSKWIYELEETDAFNKAYMMGDHILRQLETAESSDSIAKAWDFIKGWLFSNQDRFASFPSGPRYGYIDSRDKFCVIPSILEAALKEKGFNFRKVMTDFATRGYIETFKDNNKIRYTLAKRFPAISGTMRVVVFDVDNASAEDEDSSTDEQFKELEVPETDDGLPF